MWLLLACASPTLSVPAEAPPATNARPVAVSRFLVPTARGAADDTLCAWARGERTFDHTVAGWLAEGRLAWRVLEIGPYGVTFAGSADPEAAKVSADAAEALAGRCGTEPRLDTLVVIGRGRVMAGVTELAAWPADPRLKQGWLLLQDEDMPSAEGPARAGVGRDPAVVPPTGGGSIGLILMGPDVTVNNVAVRAPEMAARIREELAGGPVACGAIHWSDGSDADRFAEAVDTLAGLHAGEIGVGALIRVDPAAEPPARGSARGTGLEAARRALRGDAEIGAIPVTLPQRYSSGDASRGCGSAVLLMITGSPAATRPATDDGPGSPPAP